MARAAFRDYKRLIRGANQFTSMLKCDCINGYGLGVKRTSGREKKDQLAIIVFVNKKLSLRNLPLVNRIPQQIRIPDSRAPGGVLEFFTDVQEARFSSLEYISKMRPAKSGISIGHIDITAGTLGGLVRDSQSSKTVILSNNHVLANSNDGTVGDSILQPGPYDGGTDPADRIATLTRFVPIDFSEEGENRVDCAIATPVSPNDVLWNTIDIGPATPAEKRNLGDSDIGLYAHKTGRTTEHTQGYVQAVFATVQVKYDLFQKATFVDQIIVSQSPNEEPFSQGGDSGSLVYDYDNKCIGLLFAGSEASEDEPARTIVNPMGYVMQELKIEFLAKGDHPTEKVGKKKTTKKKTSVRKR
jgi:hypothetical protein